MPDHNTTARERRHAMPTREAQATAFLRWGKDGEIWYSNQRQGPPYFVGRWQRLPDGHNAFVVLGTGYTWKEAFENVVPTPHT